jgi:hypothetical protein
LQLVRPARLQLVKSMAVTARASETIIRERVRNPFAASGFTSEIFIGANSKWDSAFTESFSLVGE